MRIGISGTGGIGKTVLSKKISNMYSIPLIDEYVRDWLEQNKKESLFHLDIGLQENLQVSFFEYKINAERDISCFVSDRTVLDGIVTSGMRIQKTSSKLLHWLNKAREHASHYDLIIIPNMDCLKFKPDRVRQNDYDLRKKEQRQIIILANELKLPLLLLKDLSWNEISREIERILPNLKMKRKT